MLPVVLGIVIVIVVLLVLGNIYTDLLWFRSVGYSHVYTTQLWAKVELFFIFGVVMALVVGANIVVAYRLRPAFRPTSPEQESLARFRAVGEPFQRLLLAVVLLLIGVIAGVSTAGRWQTWLLWRHAVHFGTKDAQFHRDVSYFAFTYPFQRFVLGFAFTAVILSIVAAAITHYVFGALRVQTPGEKATPTARAHLSLLLGLFVLLKAVAYFLDRYGLAFSRAAWSPDRRTRMCMPSCLRRRFLSSSRSSARGCSSRTSRIAAGRCRSLRSASWSSRRSWSAASIRSSSSTSRWRRTQQTRKRFISGATSRRRGTAYGLNNVQVNPYNATTTASPGQLRNDAASLPGIRLIDPNVVAPTFDQLQQIRGYYSFPDVTDIDRYVIKGTHTDSVVAVRDIDVGALSGSQNNWINQHLVYTHGFGFVAAPANATDQDGKPAFFEKNIPPVGSLGAFEPRVYFGESSPDYSIVGAKPGANPVELDRPTEGGTGQVNTTYTGKGGVPMGSFLRRVLYAVKFKEKNILLSSRINSDSRILYIRDPRERVRKAAPYLRLRRRPVSGGCRRPDHVDRRRLHDLGRLPVLGADLAGSGHSGHAHAEVVFGEVAGRQPDQLHPQLGQGHRRCVRRHRHALRVGRDRPGPQDLGADLPEHRAAEGIHTDGPDGALPVPGRPVQGPTRHLHQVPRDRPARVLRRIGLLDRAERPDAERFDPAAAVLPDVEDAGARCAHVLADVDAGAEEADEPRGLRVRQ